MTSDDVDELAALRAAAGHRRTARRRVADAVVDHGERSPQAVELREVLRGVNEQWAQLIHQAAAAGHPLADVARAAGVAAPSLYYRLRQPVLEDSVHRPQGPGEDLSGVDEPAATTRVDLDGGSVDGQGVPVHDADQVLR